MTILSAVQCIKPHPAGNCWIGTGVDQAFGNLIRALLNVIAQGCVTDMSLIMRIYVCPRSDQKVNNIQVTPPHGIVQRRFSNFIESVHRILTLQKVVDATDASIPCGMVQLLTLKSCSKVFTHRTEL